MAKCCNPGHLVCAAVCGTIFITFFISAILLHIQSMEAGLSTGKLTTAIIYYFIAFLFGGCLKHMKHKMWAEDQATMVPPKAKRPAKRRRRK